jgi:NAD(P)-dependent dehydrogenase (short-subunit alcohol dehydrogenase family)
MKRIAVITGGSRGIGAAIALCLAKQNYDIAISYKKNKIKADKIVNKIRSYGSSAIAVKVDLGKEKNIINLFNTVDKKLGRMYALVNNAAELGEVMSIRDFESKILERIFSVNLIGPMLCAKEAVHRLSTNYGGKGGVIINISSTASYIGGAGEYVHYAVSKGGINTLTIGMANELSKDNIRVNSVVPGLTNTDFLNPLGGRKRIKEKENIVPIGRAGEPKEIAEAVAWLLSDSASYITGASLKVSGGL